MNDAMIILPSSFSCCCVPFLGGDENSLVLLGLSWVEIMKVVVVV